MLSMRRVALCRVQIVKDCGDQVTLSYHLRQDSGDYAGYEQALQRGFDKAVKAPKKVRCMPVSHHKIVRTPALPQGCQNV